MELFDILKAFFSEKKWEDVSKVDKSRNFFMINRMMSISFPLQAQAFNNTKIDPVPVVDFWKTTLNRSYKTPPGWFFTPTAKKEKIKNFLPSENAANFIKNKYEISNREIAELGKYFPKEFKEFSKGIEELLG
jgi:hypothetical protein